MRSSGSTPSRPPSAPVPLFLVVAGEDHPKACTGRKLLRAGLVQSVSPLRKPRGNPLLLDPHAERPLSPPDRTKVASSGLLGVDCSWNRLRSRGGYPDELPWLDQLRSRRRLPWLLAGNPQHFGRLGELNTVEAFAAALVVLGEADRARSMIERFAGGPGFLEVNRVALARYAACETESDLRSAESTIFDPPG